MVRLKNLDSKKITLIFLTFLLVVLFAVFAWFNYPVPAGDSQFFLAPAINFVKHGVLNSPLFPNEDELDKLIDPAGQRRFLFNPPLYPLFLSFFMIEDSIFGIFKAIGLINIAVILLSSLFFYKVVTREGELNWLKVFLATIALFALGASMGETGRPETLARLFVVLIALTPFYISKKYAWIFYGILLGFIFATHPAAGVISLLGLGILFGVTINFKDTLLKGSAMILLAFLFCLFLINLGPFGIKETVEGTLGNAIAVSRSLSLQNHSWFTVSNLVNYFILSQAAPFYGLVIILTFITGIFYLKYYKSFTNPILVFISAAIISTIIAKLIYSAGHVFYITLFAPIIFAIFLDFFFKNGKFWKLVTLGILVLVSTGFIRTMFLFPFFINQEPTLNRGRGHFKEILAMNEKNPKIGVTGPLWVLSEEYEKMYIYNFWPEKPRFGTDFVFFGQRYSGMLEPPAISGCKIINDAFSRKTPNLFGIKLGNTMPGYGYAVYNCLGNDN